MVGSILIKSDKGHDPIKTLGVFIKISYIQNFMFIYNNDIYGGTTTMQVVDDQLQRKKGNEKQFKFYLYTKSPEWVETRERQRLWRIGYVDHVDDNNTRMLFDFMHEYLRLSPEEYFWIAGDHLFGWTEMQRLKQRPFDKDWCFKKVEP